MNTAFLEYFEKIDRAIKEGYGGMLQNGNLVDRREHPEAYPLQKNTMMGVPEPKLLPTEVAQQEEV